MKQISPQVQHLTNQRRRGLFSWHASPSRPGRAGPTAEHRTRHTAIQTYKETTTIRVGIIKEIGWAVGVDTRNRLIEVRLSELWIASYTRHGRLRPLYRRVASAEPNANAGGGYHSPQTVRVLERPQLCCGLLLDKN